MEETIRRLRGCGVVPVIKLERAEDAVPLADALQKGGLDCVEITFRTKAAEEAIRRIHNAFPNLLIAAGTVLSPDQSDVAMAAGASFLVSPGLNPTVVDHCNKSGYRIIPGICTPSELEQAMSFGLSYVKFFPAEASGGVAKIRAMSAPYSKIGFMPTGGIHIGNVKFYLSCPGVFACGGSWMVPTELIVARDFDSIQRLAAEAASLVKEFRNL